MADVSRPTKAIHMAHARILKSYERAKMNMADIPLGQERVDPRTAKKRAEETAGGDGFDTNLSRILYNIRSQQNTGEEQ
jgi:hypothetical protein